MSAKGGLGGICATGDTKAAGTFAGDSTVSLRPTDRSGYRFGVNLIATVGRQALFSQAMNLINVHCYRIHLFILSIFFNNAVMNRNQQKKMLIIQSMANKEQNRPFRFYDNRQKYLTFVNTCNEKWKIAERATEELKFLQPKPPALRFFDAGMGDASVLSHVLRAAHRQYPTIPFYIVGKEISLEDLRLSLYKFPDRLVEHPASVIIVSNLFYSEAPTLSPHRSKKSINWHEVVLKGSSSHGFNEQLRAIDELLVDGWQVKASTQSGNPLYVKPSVLVIYREDHKFILNAVIPKPNEAVDNYDLIIASQPWRARLPVSFKVDNILKPLALSLAKNGRLFIVQSCGNNPGLEIINKVWPDLIPFPVGRRELIDGLAKALGKDASAFNLDVPTDDDALLSYQMLTLPTEVEDTIGTSTLFAAWNAAIYAAQIEDKLLTKALTNGRYLDATSQTMQKHGGLWFNDEVFVIVRKRR